MADPSSASPPTVDQDRSPLAVLVAFLKLGVTSFGGPVAHLGFFRTEFVARRKWLDEAAFADIVALCQILPGPASSQVGIALGLRRAGFAGALAAWIGFTLPSALAMVALAYGIGDVGTAAAPWLHGLRVTAVAVVALALWSMARNLAPDAPRATIAVAAAALALAIPSAMGQVTAILLGGLAGWAILGKEGEAPAKGEPHRHGRRLGGLALLLFAVLLLGLPAMAASSGSQALRLVDSFYRTGSLVFGGGHVVLPLLRAEVVPAGWISDNTFLAGYGLAQAVPGPLFSFAAYLGAAMGPEPNGWQGALLCLAAIYLPSFLLVIGVLPFWETLRGMGPTQAALRGVNAAVVGLLLAALYSPGWTTAIRGPADFALGLVAFLLLALWKLPPWLVVILGAVGGFALDRLSGLLA
jgi:chromate transporter